MEALQRLHNRGSISTGYDVDNSLKLEADNDEHLYVTTMTGGNRRTWTYSIWFKRTELEFTNVLFHFGVENYATRMMLDDTDQLWIDICDTGSTLYRSKTNRLFRDTSAWYHVVLRVDTTQSTEADRMKLYVNGVEETSWIQHQIPTQNLDTLANTTAGSYDAMGIGTYVWAGGGYDGQFSGYIAQVAHVDGQSYAATEFGEFDDDTGIWKPKDVSGLTYGTSNNSFLLDFSNSADLGNDSSGNNNDWSLSNIAAADQATDTPTNNFCTLNPIFVGNYYDAPSEGGTYISMDGTNQHAAYAGTMGVTQGKWYYETYINSRSASYGLHIYVGYHTFQGNYHDSAMYDSSNHESLVLYFMHTGDYYTWDSGSRTHTGDPDGLGTSNVGQFVGVALNLDDNQISYYINGSAISNASNLALDDLGDEADAGTFAIPALSVYDNNHTVNFGGYTAATISSAQTDENGYGTFEHAPPSGYYSLCTKNLAEYG